jgi:hypothetical protein
MVAIIVAEALVWMLAPVDTRGLTPFGKVLVQGERHAVVATHRPIRSVVTTGHRATGSAHRTASPSSQATTHRHSVTVQPAPVQQGAGSAKSATSQAGGHGAAATPAVPSQPGSGQATSPGAAGVSPLSPASHAYLCWIERTPRGVDGC